MQRHLAGSLAVSVMCIIAAAVQAAHANDGLEAGFRNPPPEARPGVYWYFMDGNLNREGMTADLESMTAAGIGNLVFLEVNVGVPRGPVDFLSEEWQELFAHAVREAGIQTRLVTFVIAVASLSLGTTVSAQDRPGQSKALKEPDADPRDPFRADGPYSQEMAKKRETARPRAPQSKPVPASTATWYSPWDRDLLELLRRLAWKGIRNRLVIEPPPTRGWHLELLDQRDNVVLRLSAHRDTPIAWHGNTVFWADVQQRTRGFSVTAFDSASGEKLWERQVNGLGPADENLTGNWTCLRVHGERLWIDGREPNGRYTEKVNVDTGELLERRVDRRVITSEELRLPLDAELAGPNPHKLLRYQRIVFDEEAGIAVDCNQATLLHSLDVYQGNCTLHLIPDTRAGEDVMTLDFRDGKRIVYTISAGPNLVFRAVGDRLFLASYASRGNGCGVRAVDLETGRGIWSTLLEGVGFVAHSAYSNHVNMELRPKGLEIIGHESYGDYWERLNPVTGRTIDHRVFRLGWE